MATRTIAPRAMRAEATDYSQPTIAGLAAGRTPIRLVHITADDLAAAGFRPAAPESLDVVEARHDIASFHVGQKTRWMATRDLTLAEQAEYRCALNTLRRTRRILAAAGRQPYQPGGAR
ncbi:hypothetical protein [Streptomyces sp. NPDC017529]|uniref:hypothetical protein n=1 Tax=Streptomyces sp. NPDC017529 TaxID=3365000 RepID=UPI003794B5AE